MRLEYYHLIIFKRSNDNQNVLEKINGRIRAILFFGQRYFGRKNDSKIIAVKTRKNFV